MIGIQHSIVLVFGIISSLILSPRELENVPQNTSVQQQVDKAIAKGLDGIIVCVEQDGRFVHYTSGWKDRDQEVPARADDLFKIASVSKMYIAAATAKFIAADRLSLEDTLAHLLPHVVGRVEYADQITVRMLLQHRSGIPDFMRLPDYPFGNPPDNLEAFEQMVFDHPAKFAPNARYKYSNTNFLFLGAILDKTLGYSHHLYIKEQILDPLALKNTFSLLSDVDAERVMSGYYVKHSGDVKSLDHIAPGGSMIATAEDVAIFLRALVDGVLLSSKEQEIYASVYPFEHTGLLSGYQTIARYFGDIDAVVIQFVNTSGGNSWSKGAGVYRRIVKVLHENE